MDASKLLADIRLLPVVALQDARDAVPLAETLLEAGIGALEITLRTDAALQAIENVATDVPGILLGAGSIRRPQDFQDVRDAGARFAVSPGATEALLDAATLPFVPAAATPSEMLRLLEHGYRLQKFFPAEQQGGARTLQSISAPIPELRFCPSGGINAANVGAYTALECVAIIGGSWFLPQAKLADGDFDALRALAEEALAIVSAGQPPGE